MKLDLTTVMDLRHALNPEPMSRPLAVVVDGKERKDAEFEVRNGVVCITTGTRKVKK